MVEIEVWCVMHLVAAHSEIRHSFNQVSLLVTMQLSGMLLKLLVSLTCKQPS